MIDIITNDYVGMAIENNMKLEALYLESVLDVFDYERELIEDCLEAGMITLEALQKTEVEVTKKRGIIDRILDALNALFGKFKQKITILSDKNNAWLQKNLVYLSIENFKKLPEIEAFPLWERGHAQIMLDLQKIANMVINQTKEKQPGAEEIEAVARKVVGGKNSLGKDAIMYFRTGKAGQDLKPVKINGEGLSKYFQDMYTYAIKYDKLVVPSVEKYMNQLKNMVKTIAPPEKVNESFCYLESLNYSDTLLGLLPNPYESFVLEETKDEQMKKGQTNDSGEGPKSVTGIKMTGEGGDSEDKSQKINDSQYIKDITNILKILQGAALTVLEEKYLLYISIFKAVLKNAGVDPDKQKQNQDNSDDDSDKGNSNQDDNSSDDSNNNTSNKKKKKKKKK